MSKAAWTLPVATSRPNRLKSLALCSGLSADMICSSLTDVSSSLITPPRAAAGTGAIVVSAPEKAESAPHIESGCRGVSDHVSAEPAKAPPATRRTLVIKVPL